MALQTLEISPSRRRGLLFLLCELFGKVREGIGIGGDAVTLTKNPLATLITVTSRAAKRGFLEKDQPRR